MIADIGYPPTCLSSPVARFVAAAGLHFFLLSLASPLDVFPSPVDGSAATVVDM